MEVQLKPIIPWMGGKRKLVNTILPLIPKSDGVYYEPFVGAGAIFLAHRPKKAVISDINPDIINMWEQVKKNPNRLINALTSHETNREYWNKCNKEFPKIKQNTVKRASYFCFLVSYGFGGLYKIKSDGTFNNTFTTGQKGKVKGTPFKQQIKNIENISIYLNSKKIKIICQDYDKIIKKCKKGDLVYLDPPYVSRAKQTKLMYGKTDFDNSLLCENYKCLSGRKIKCLMSNLDSTLITNPLREYKTKKIKLNIQWTTNGNITIQNKTKKHKTVRNEILIMNF
jgi:DNA adenine methylase